MKNTESPGITSQMRRSPAHYLWRTLPAILGIICLLSACDSPGPEEYLYEGQQSVAAGDMKSAIISFKNAAREAPENAHIRYELGLAYLKTGSFVNAQKELSTAVDLDPSNPAYNLATAKAAVRLRNWVDVETFLEGSHSWDPDLQASALAQRTMVQLSEDQVEAAQLVLDEALRLAPENTDALYASAVVRLARSDNAGATDTLRKILELDQGHARALSAMGALEYAQQNFAEAETLFLQARAVEYADLETTLSLARVYIAREDYDRAREELAKLLAAIPQAWYPNYLQSLISLREKNYSEALQESEISINSNKEYMPAYFVAAVAATALGNFETAQARLNKLLFKAPHHVPSQKLLAFIAMKLGETQTSVEKLAAIEPKSFTTSDLQLLLAAGQVALSGGDQELAQSFFDSAAELGDIEGEIARIRIESAMARGDVVTGLDHAREVAESESDPLLALYAQGASLLAQQEFEQALDAAAELETTFPDMPQGSILRGMALVMQEDYPGAGAAFVAALEIEPENLDALSNLAIMAARQGDLETAKRRWEEVLAIQPNRLKALFQLYKIERALGNQEQALKWLQRAVVMHPGSDYVILEMARYRLSQGDSAGVVAMIESALETRPGSYELVMFYGELQRGLGRLDQAIKQFRRAAELSPTSAEPHYQLALTLEETGRWDEAARAARRVLDEAPDHSGALLISARSALREGHTRTAASHLTTLQQSEPDAFYTRELAAQISLAEGDAAKAAQQFASLYDERRNSLLVNQYAVSLWNTAQREKALAILDDWLKETPGDIATRHRLAMYLVSQKNFRAARDQFATLVNHSPTAENQNDLAWVLLQLGEKNRALDYAITANSLDPANPVIQDTLGTIYYSLGDLDKADALLAKASAAQPGNPNTLFHLAQVKAALEQKDEARRLLTTLLERRSADLTPERRQEIADMLKEL